MTVDQYIEVRDKLMSEHLKRKEQRKSRHNEGFPADVQPKVPEDPPKNFVATMVIGIIVLIIISTIVISLFGGFGK